MYIDFEDYRPEIPRVERALTPLEAVLITVIFHLLMVIAVLVMPDLPQRVFAITPPPQAAAVSSPRENRTFVFVQPKLDVSRPQPRVDVPASDQDRVMSSEKRPNAANPLPYARGNSRAYEEADLAPVDRGRDAASAVAAGTPNPASEGEMASNTAPSSAIRLPDAPGATPPLKIGQSGGSGQLGDALRNLQRYVQQQSFDNPQGSGDGPHPFIQFDTKGVEFGPWIRRFIAQVKRNWFIPQAAMLMKGHVVITFNIHKNGAITDIDVKTPASIGAFNNAAVNALIASNPTQPLPPEYPSESAFFTVTFFYNEEPPSYYR
jgi:TonB family protein